MKTYGRIDYMPRLKVWRVIWYVKSKDVPCGDYATQEEASQALQDRIKRITYFQPPKRSSSMDPSKTLELCSEAMEEGDYSDALSWLGDYYRWRIKGGFEPERGDETAQTLESSLAVLIDKSV